MEQGVIPSYLQVINCGYCAKSMRRKNLKEHTSRCHQGHPPTSVEGEALKRLLEELQNQRQQEKEKKDLERLALANEKRIQKERTKALEKEKEINHQRALEAQRKEQEEQRKKKKRELLRIEKRQARSTLPKVTTGTTNSTNDTANTDPIAHANSEQAVAMTTVIKTVADGRNVSSPVTNDLSHAEATLNVMERENMVRINPTQPGSRSVTSAPNDNSCAQIHSFRRKEFAANTITQANVHGRAESCLEAVSTDHSYMSGETSSNRESSLKEAESEMRLKFKQAKTMDEIINCCPNFVYNKELGSITCVPCASSAYSKPIQYQPNSDDSKSLQLAKFRDSKKKLLDHLYRTSIHKRNTNTSLATSECDANVDCGLRVMRAIYGKIKTGGGYKSIEQSISERAADDLDVGNLNHGRQFASSMVTPIYQAVKRRVEKSIKKVMPGFGRPPPFCLIADKMTPARTTLQIVGIIAPSQETGKLQSICLGVKECLDGTGLGTSEEMVDCLKDYFSSEEIKHSLVGVAVDGAYHHHNISDHLPSVLQLSSDQKQLIATNWDAAHLIELSAQKSRGQNSKDKAISTPWIKETFDTVTSVKNFAGRGKNWKDLQETTSLEAARCLNDDQSIQQYTKSKPLKKFQSFSNTRFARFSQRVLGNMRENYKATCQYLASKPKEGAGLLNKLTSPDFALRLCGLDDIYDYIGRTSERLQSSRLYAWNTIEILEEANTTLSEIADSLRHSQHHTRMQQFNLAVDEVSTTCTYQGITLQGAAADLHAQRTLAGVREELAKHIDDFTQDLQRRTQEHTPQICNLSREAFALERVINHAVDFVPREFDEITKLTDAAGVFEDHLTMDDWHREYVCFKQAVKAEKTVIESVGSRITGQTPVGIEETIYSKFFTDKNSTESFKNVTYLLCRSAVQSSCEAVTEGMGSVVKNTLQGRENMAIEKLSHEVFVRLNGPKSNRSCNGILREAGDIRFGDRTKWHFVSSPQAKYKGSSKVLSRLNDEEEKFQFESESDDE